MARAAASMVLMAFCVHALAAPPRIIEGRVVRVIDGDTLDVSAAGRRHRVRLGAIDAPEMDQSHGRSAANHLRRLALRWPVTVQAIKRDAHGRWVGQAWIAPAQTCPDARESCARTLDIGLAQVRVGLAWHYRQYAAEQDPATRGRYAQQERVARTQRLGLWAARHPVAPWDWRHRRAR